MDIAISIIKLIGGLVLLIYGMDLLSVNLKKIAGEKFELILKKATDNIFKGLLTGILITVALQSSSATTVMVVGFVNAGLLKLKNAIPIIMGANIGTTVTAQILRLASLDNSILSFLSPSTLAPIFLVLGLLLIESKKKQKTKDLGQLFVGIGLLFTGLMTMVDIASGFSDLPILTTILTKLSNPVLGVVAGAVITMIVQSSSATVGILQAISTTGFTTYANTIPVILGQNIGTCLTSILSGIGASKNAKRTAAVHLYFNLIGTVIFMIAIYGYQRFVGFSFWNSAIDMGGIANFHLIFNVVSTLILLPFTGLLEKLTILTIKDKKSDKDEEEEENDYLSVLNTLDERITTLPSLAINNSLNSVLKMEELSEKNLNRAMKLIDKFDQNKLEHIQEREDAIDKIEVKITDFLVNIRSSELTEKESKNVKTVLKIAADFEKVGDYSFKIAKIVQLMNENNQKLSTIADKELKIMYNLAEDILIRTHDVIKYSNINNVIEIEALREIAEDYREEFKSEHIERLKRGKCSVDIGIAFIEILTAYEKLISHCLNIAISSINLYTDKEYLTKHEYLNTLYLNNSDELKEKINNFKQKYELLEKDDKLKIAY